MGPIVISFGLYIRGFAVGSDRAHSGPCNQHGEAMEAAFELQAVQDPENHCQWQPEGQLLLHGPHTNDMSTRLKKVRCRIGSLGFCV